MTAGEHEETRDLLAACALGALEPGDLSAVSRHLAGCAPCAAEAERLRETVRLLDGPGAEDGMGPGSGTGSGRDDGVRGDLVRDDGVRGDLVRDDGVLGDGVLGDGVRGDGVLALALRARPPAALTRVAPHAAPYAAAVAGLQALLRELDAPERDGAWRTPVVHDWDVQATVAHLLAADEPLAVGLGLTPRVPRTPPLPGVPWRDTWAARTAEVVAHERRRSPAQTVTAWAAQAAELLAAPEARDPRPASAELTLMDLPLPVTEQFVLRAFELWIHTDDIGRALGLAVPPPPDEHLGRMVGLGVMGVAVAMGSDGPPVRLTVADTSVVLGTAAGALAPPVETRLALDPVDFCMLLGGRYEPAAVPCEVSGDERAARSVLERAASLAWL